MKPFDAALWALELVDMKFFNMLKKNDALASLVVDTQDAKWCLPLIRLSVCRVRIPSETWCCRAVRLLTL